MDTQQITGTHINYLFVCERKLWLFSKGLQMEHGSEQVYEGKLTGELTYPDRPVKYTELALPGGKIDYYDAKNKVVHEVKQSNKVEDAHIAQVKYYLYLLREIGVENPTGILEYPKLRERETINWEQGDQAKVKQWLKKISQILTMPTPPPVINAGICKKCSYHDLCYV